MIATKRDEVEAETRRRMAALTRARGWDSERRRAAELAEIDRLLDQWADLG